MKQLRILGLMAFIALAFTACKDLSYKTTPSGLKYKIIDGGSKDTLKDGDWLKMNVIQKISGHKDTVLENSYGKMPAFVKLQPLPPGQPMYSPAEIFHLLKKGDSLISVMYVDSLIKKGFMPEEQMPPFMKKGDKITITFKVIDVFKNDSLANLDQQKEMEKDAPRQKKEQEEMMEKMMKEQEAQQKADEAALEKSGEKAKQIKEVEDYLAAKKITATKTPVGTFVKIDNPGDGPAAVDGKFVTVKYTGKKVLTDSTFESNSFTYQVAKQGMIKGFEDGIKQFKQGGKGTVYIPGYLAYGKNPPMGSPFKAYEPLYFDIQITAVSDTMPAPQPPVAQPAAPAPKKKK